MLVAQVLETEAVGEGLADGLEGEGGVDVPQGEPLAVHGADGDSPVLVTVLGQLRDVGSHITLIVVPHPVIYQSCTDLQSIGSSHERLCYLVRDQKMIPIGNQDS